MQKSQLSDLPGIMANLRQFASKRFIIFFDDLSFEESDSDYKYLKSAIEGGVESKPENVLIYATSNRRHLIKETWHDRNSEQDEMFRNDRNDISLKLSQYMLIGCTLRSYLYSLSNQGKITFEIKDNIMKWKAK